MVNAINMRARRDCLLFLLVRILADADVYSDVDSDVDSDAAIWRRKFRKHRNRHQTRPANCHQAPAARLSKSAR